MPAPAIRYLGGGGAVFVGALALPSREVWRGRDSRDKRDVSAVALRPTAHMLMHTRGQAQQTGGIAGLQAILGLESFTR